MGQSEVLLETGWGTCCDLDENKVKTWWEQQKSTKPYYRDIAYPPPPSWKKTRSKPRGALEKMDEVPGSRPEGCVRQVACPLKLTSFLSQILIIILVRDNHSFTHTSTLQHFEVPYCSRWWQFTIIHINEVGDVGGKYTKFTSTWKLVNLEFGWRDKKKPRSSVLRILFPYMQGLPKI
jgi:hypothetical protein